MRVWRALKALGAAVLRDGVYLLPGNADRQAGMERLARDVVESGGEAHILMLDRLPPDQEKDFQSRFDRTSDYARLISAIAKAKAGLATRRRNLARRSLKQLHREFQTLHSTDFFSGAAAEQAAEALSEAEMLARMRLAGEPNAQSGSIQRLAIKDYRARIWATRAHPWVDRLASAWLIKRFIDPKARFVWFKHPKDNPRQALGFDFDGARFTHVGARVTFEVLMLSFGLEQDKALQRVGGLVHYLDVGGVPVPEAVGLEVLLKGARESIADDNRLLSEASRIIEHLYNAYQIQ